MSMKDGLNYPTFCISLKVIYEGLWDPPLISKLVKKFFMTTQQNHVTFKSLR